LSIHKSICMSAIQDLIRALEGTQDWNGTHVGECIAAVEAEGLESIADLRLRLADAQARAEKAEQELKLVRVAVAEASHNDCQAGVEIEALKKQLSATYHE
jgi:hypothetical protein